MNLVRETALPYGWDRTIGQNNEESVVTCFSHHTNWFDVSIYQHHEGEYQIIGKRGPEHPRQNELNEPLLERVGVEPEGVEKIATAFMLCVSDVDPFTNKFTRGMTKEDIESIE